MWTDFDYEGLTIAAALRRALPDLDWFAPGYHAMLEHLSAGNGHPLTDVTKGAQAAPDPAQLWGFGEIYLGSIQHHQPFVDQEAVLLSEIIADPPGQHRMIPV